MPGSRRGGSPKLRKGRWSKAELTRLKELVGRRSEEAIARELNRSVHNVRRTARKVLLAPARTGPWSAEEVQRLKESLGVTTADTIARILGRDVEEVREQVINLGRIQQTGRWKPGEVTRLKRIYGRRTDEDLSKIFGRSAESIHRQAVRLCLSKDKAFLRRLRGVGSTQMPRWSKAELEQLVSFYPTHANLDIAQRLNRSVKSVVSKAHHLGLRKSSVRLKEMGRENVGLRYSRR